MKYVYAFGALGFMAGCAAAQDGGVDTSNEVTSRAMTVESAVNHDTSLPLYMLEPAQRRPLVAHEVKRLPRPGHVTPEIEEELEPFVLDGPEILDLAPTNLANFDGIGNGVGGFAVNSAPPDTEGDVGPNHYVQIVNSDIAVFNKTTGAIILGPEPTNTLWAGFGGLCQTDNDGDGVVIYDPIADRWVISQFAVTGTTTHFLHCIAVSTTADPTGSWNRYSFDYGALFPDYPKMGVWPDAYYQTFNLFNGNAFAGGRVCAYDRAKMLAGAAATQVCFNPTDAGSGVGGLLAADLDGARQPPAGSPNYVLALGNNANQLAFYKFHVDFATPANSTLTGPTDITVTAFTEACAATGTCIPQSGSTQQLDSLGDRLMFRLAYRNLGDHEALVASHSITSGSVTGVRWYELRVAGGTPSVFQQGTFLAPGTNAFTWMSSAAMDQSGNIALGYSVSSTALHPEIHYTGRLVGDSAGAMTQGDNTIINGAGTQTGSLSRWGDYAMMAVDPSNDCTFFFTSEYIPANGSFNWKTRVGSFTLPNCGGTVTNDFTISANPTSVTAVQGASATTTISTAVSAGSAQSVALTVTGVPTGATATLNPTSVTAGGSSTLTLTAGASTAPGSYNVVVTGTGASATHSVTVSFTVTATNNFSISANPASVSAVQGGSATSTISTAVTAGSAGSVALAVSGVPTGATGTLSPTSVTAGGSSTLTLTAGASTAAGTYTVTVTGTEGSATHSTTVSFTVTVPVANDFSIAASPSSVTAVQGASATSTISTAVVSGTAQSVALTATGLPAGATASFNPTSVTAGASSVLTLTAGATTAVGTYSITVTGTGTSATHTTTVSFTVTAPVANDFSIAASPTSVSVAQGGSGASTISTAVISGSAQSVSLTASGVPTGATASFAPSSVTAGASSTLTLSVGASTAVGSYPITVTGTGASATHTTTVTLTVTATGGCATGNFVSTNVPKAIPDNNATGVSSTLAVTGTGTVTAVTLSLHITHTWRGDLSGTLKSPSGTTVVAFARPNANDSADNIILTNAAISGLAGQTAAGTWTLTVVDHAAQDVGTIDSWSLNITANCTPPPPSPIVNPGFENGVAGWTTVGSTASSTTAHSGSTSAMIGSAAAFNGDSSVSQTFTVPTGATTLTFWYQVHCTDTVTFDWATATLTDNTTGTTVTPLAHTCNNSATWVQVSAAVTAGHSVTLTLIDHDDNFAGDPTFTLFDDVSVQ